jgi:DNA-binding transcriptional ArsR family regulator
MKPLFHPSADDITLEGIMHALSHPVRLHIFAELSHAESPQTCGSLAETSDRVLPKSTLSGHFSVLREAGLVRSERKGVEVYNIPRHDDLRDRFGPLIPAIIDAQTTQKARSRNGGPKHRMKKL